MTHETNSDAESAYDPTTVEVLRMRFDNTVQEMGATLKNTSGSPILTEAQDFSVALLDHEAQLTSYVGYVVAHIGPSRVSLERILEKYSKAEIQPGDAFIDNDPHDSGALHKSDVGVLTPVFYDGEIVNWLWSEAHVFDVGGIAPGSFSPQVIDTYGEGFKIPALKILEEGEINEMVKQMIQSNSRLPVRVFNDIKSLIAGNNVARERIHDIIDDYGIETYRDYAGHIQSLSERAVRRRIEDIADGTYTVVDWSQHDGHENRLYRIQCELRVDGDELTVDFSGTDPEAPGVINAGQGALIGCVWSVLTQLLCWDIYFNSGCMEPVTITAPEGSVVNASRTAGVGYAHMDAGIKAADALTTAFSQALRASEDEALQERAMGEMNDTWSIETWGGTDQYGAPFAWLNMDGGGMGGGAQTSVDGLDVAGLITQVGNAIPDIEWKEQSYPALHLWRRLEPNSGGPGKRRGGRGLDFAWTMWDTPDDEFTGAICYTSNEIPNRGHGGGMPGTPARIYLERDTNVAERLADDVYPTPETIEGETEFPAPKEAPVSLETGDVVRHYTGGGAGLGDPITRDPDLVAKEVRDGWLDPDVAERAYGVVLDEDGALDEDATERRRDRIRTERLEEAED
ncbi:hydantoinase B/oxoprolinase family protein [Haloplanus pelagicus]|jgi:N-methylhydantoinase B|uniref:hydantoinase B/oxoprolinase family protein n=1 Tax=Haloplanus pelagicus TaxID=2949995 RepID=UPI00203FED5C|nr:hydantoinase B/oxoprolinase family protein [Haloplanus sp. HW8-1]